MLRSKTNDTPVKMLTSCGGNIFPRPEEDCLAHTVDPGGIAWFDAATAKRYCETRQADPLTVSEAEAAEKALADGLVVRVGPNGALAMTPAGIKAMAPR
ncbi:MAG TPA: hypothetical protein VNT79_09950 [Phycisphaerae bacterium]|nr:hypothetical protein [Phycisphaerae bacterium]